MPKRILLIGALLTILLAAGVSVLFILDLITGQEMWTTLSKAISAIAVMTVAVVLAAVMVRMAKRA